MSHIISEITDLALSLKADADTIYSAAAQFAPLNKRAEAAIRAGAIRSKSRRLRKLLLALVDLQASEQAAEAERRDRLAAGCVNAPKPPVDAAISQARMSAQLVGA